jgi:hypothetical protein
MYIDIAHEKLCFILKRRYFKIENANADSYQAKKKNIAHEPAQNFFISLSICC